MAKNSVKLMTPEEAKAAMYDDMVKVGERVRKEQAVYDELQVKATDAAKLAGEAKAVLTKQQGELKKMVERMCADDAVSKKQKGLFDDLPLRPAGKSAAGGKGGKGNRKVS